MKENIRRSWTDLRRLNRIQVRPDFYDHSLGIRRPDVVEQVLASAGLIGEAVHHILHDIGAGIQQRNDFHGLTVLVEALKGRGVGQSVR